MDEYIKEIPGWMGIAELNYLHELVKTGPSDALYVELGAWMGLSTAAEYTAIHGDQTVVAIDSWLGQEDLRFEAHSEITKSDVFLTFLYHMNKLNVTPEWYTPDKHGATYLRMLADDAATLFADGSIYRVIIDCDHRFVGHDIDKWEPKLRPDGKFCGHDWNWEGVKKQVEQRLTVEMVIGDLWIGA